MRIKVRETRWALLRTTNCVHTNPSLPMTFHHTFLTLLSFLFLMLSPPSAVAHSPICEFRQGLALEEVEIGMLLTWSTATQEDMHFIIQRSADGEHYTSIGQVEATHHNGEVQSYQFLDLEIGHPASYYRLVCVGQGEQTLLTPSMYHHRKIQNSWRITRMTSTITNVPFRFIMESVLGTTLRITLRSLDHQVLQSFPVDLNAGENEVILQMDPLPTGAYRLDLESDGEHEHLILQKIPSDRLSPDGYAIKE